MTYVYSHKSILTTNTVNISFTPPHPHPKFPPVPVQSFSLSSVPKHYGLNYVLPKFICWGPNPSYLRMELYLELGPSKRKLSYNQAIKVGPNLVWRVPCKKRKCGNTKRHQGHLCTEESSHEDTRRRQPSIWKLRRDTSKWNQTCRQPWNLTFSFQNSEKINFCCLSHRVCAILLGQP